MHGRRGSCARRVTGPGCRGSARTGCGTPRRPRCSGPGASLAGDRPGAAPPRAEDHRDLRQGRPHGAAGARAAVAVARRCGMTALRDALARLSARPPPARVRDAPGRPPAGRVRRVPRAGAALSGSPPSWRWRGRGMPAQRAPASLAPAADRSCAGSRATWRRSTRPARSRRRTCCPAHRPRIAPYIYTERGDRGADRGRRDG